MNLSRLFFQSHSKENRKKELIRFGKRFGARICKVQQEFTDLEIPVFLATASANEIDADVITYVLIQVKCNTIGKLPTNTLCVNPVDLKLEKYQG